MADITMCQNKKCKDRKSCHRFTAPAGKYQYYFLFDSYEIPPKDKTECKHFWDNKGYPNERKEVK